MKIALIGVPGSRKTSTALKLWDPYEGAKGGNARVIDKYVEVLSKRTDYIYGYRATYIGNLHIALERWAKESDPLWEGEYTITCGTLLETMVYNALYYVDRQHLADVATPNALRAELSTQILGAMFADTWNYDVCFHLAPFTDEHTELDKYIGEAIDQFNPPNCHVIDGPFEERVSKVKEICDQATATT